MCYNTNIISYGGRGLKHGVSVDRIIEVSAKLSEEVGMENLTLKMIADELKIKSPSLYNHVVGLDDIKSKLMIYGWNQIESKMINAAAGVSGYDALRSMSSAFYDYAIRNKGIFNAMLWYNKYENEITKQTTSRLFDLLFKILTSLNISQENINHIIRTFRSFLEGYALLVNNNAFGHSLPVKKSFDLSVEIIINGIKCLEGVTNINE